MWVGVEDLTLSLFLKIDFGEFYWDTTLESNNVCSVETESLYFEWLELDMLGFIILYWFFFKELS